MLEIKNYIDGKIIAPIDGNYLDNYRPDKGEIYGKIPGSNSNDVALAYQAAQSAFEGWSNTPAEQKFRILNKIAELIESNLEKFALAETMDQGKPVWLSKREINRAAQNFRFFATAAIQFSSESHAMENTAINFTLRQPIGVVGCISPWNLPLYLFSWKIAPALAAGNCVVAKPSEFTPYTAYLLSEICIEAGLPNGVLNIVHGLGGEVGQAIVEHPNIKAISFTGGTATGKRIVATAGPMFKKLSLELGGKNPTIIFNDCDIDTTIKTVINATFLNQGEICLCGSRILIQSGIYETFKTKFLAAISELTVGDPQNDATKIGAIVSKPHFDKVMDCIEIAKNEGGTLLCGGHAVKPEGFENGWYIAPTLFENLPAQCRTNQEEIFGPVATLNKFETLEEAIALANSTPYGLASSVWTSNINTANKVANQLKCGIVWINCWLHRDLRTPFGGTGQSGVGREGGWEAMRFFTEAKNVCISF